jgi:hypothetical protein
LGSSKEKIEIKEITRGMVVLSPTSFRAILEVSPINFSLKDEEEKKAIIATFEGFLNSLLFEVQILVLTRSVDVEHYARQIEEYAHKEENAILKRQALAHVDFVRGLVAQNNLLQKKIYLVVPYDEGGGTPFSRKGKGGKGESWEDQLNRARMQLNQRVATIRTQLATIGLRARELETHELAELFYVIYNPRRAEIQRLTKDEFKGYSAYAITSTRWTERRPR